MKKTSEISLITSHFKKHNMEQLLLRIMALGMVTYGVSEASTPFIPQVSESCDLDLPADGCSCHVNYNNVISVMCVDLGLTQWPDLTSLGQARLELLDLSGNTFPEVPRHAFGDTLIRHLTIAYNRAPLEFRTRFLTKKQRRYLRVLDLQGSNVDNVLSVNEGLSGLVSLDLSGNDIASILDSSFRDLGSLKELHLGSVMNIEENAFAPLEDLQRFEISPVSTVHFPNGDLFHFFGIDNILTLQNVKTLIIKSSRGYPLGVILGFFQHLEHLEIIDSFLTDSQINGEVITFGEMTVLNLGNNALSKMPNRLLRGIASLEYLDLSNNSIRRITRSAFSDVVNLRYIDLRSNRITAITGRPFALLSHLEVLDLSENRLAVLEMDQLPAHFMDNMILYVAGNNWLCNCNILWMVENAARQHQGSPGPFDPYEISNTLTCENLPNGSIELMFETYNELNLLCSNEFGFD